MKCEKHGTYYGACASCLKERDERRKQTVVEDLRKQVKQLQTEIEHLKQKIDNQQGVISFRTHYLETERKTVKVLQAELADVKDTLQSLADIQNGSPLIRDEEKWQAIMDKAYKLLSKP